MEKKRARSEERGGWKERLCQRLDLPPDVFLGEGLVEIRGRYAVCVKGCGKILTYTPEEICVRMGQGCLRIEGKRLICTSYHAGAIGVDGMIDRVSFEEG